MAQYFDAVNVDGNVTSDGGNVILKTGYVKSGGGFYTDTGNINTDHGTIHGLSINADGDISAKGVVKGKQSVVAVTDDATPVTSTFVTNSGAQKPIKLTLPTENGTWFEIGIMEPFQVSVSPNLGSYIVFKGKQYDATMAISSSTMGSYAKLVLVNGNWFMTGDSGWNSI